MNRYSRVPLVAMMIVAFFVGLHIDAYGQSGNPRGIYKMVAVETRNGVVNQDEDQYKICTDSVTLNLFVSPKDRLFTISHNLNVYDYTGDVPFDENKSDLIYDSDDKHFTLKWWSPKHSDPHSIFPSDDWCVEKYEAGKFSVEGKVLYDAIACVPQPDNDRPLIGAWRLIGSLPIVSDVDIERLRRDAPLSESYNKFFYVFTPSHWLFLKFNNGFVGSFNTASYNGKDTFEDHVSDVPFLLSWVSNNCVILKYKNETTELNIVLERITDGVPVLNRIAYWYVDRDFMWFLRDAEKGNADSQFKVGLAYIQGTDVEQDTKKGWEWLMKSAESGSKYAQLTIGLAYVRGEMVEADLNKGYEWLLRAARQGEPTAQTLIGVFYLKGEVVQQDEEEAYKWFGAAAQGGNVFAQMELGYYFRNKDKGNNEELAFACFMAAANQGNAEAQNSVGYMYEYGKGVEQNDSLAVFWYRKSAEQGYALAQRNMAFRYRNGNGVEKNMSIAYELFLKAAEGGNASAQNEVAWMLYTGEDVPQDLQKAFEWAQKAVEQGNSYGYGTLAEMYYKGKGVAKNKQKAFELYTKGAELGDKESTRMLAVMYKNGEGTKKDKQKATYWQKKYDEMKEQ